MSENTNIEWTDATWNPVTGCTKVSAGCKHCYAERDWTRLSANQKTRYYGREFTDVQCHANVLDKPVRWTKQRMIFVNSMSDLFHEAVPDDFIDYVFGIMWACLWARDQQPGHIFQVLTKRAERMHDYLRQDRRKQWASAAVNKGGGADPDRIWDQVIDATGPHPRIWLGVSIEDQKTADERIPPLLETPAAVRWVSAEPLLGPVNLNRIDYQEDCGEDFGGWNGFDAIGTWGNALTGEWFSAERSGATLRGHAESFETSHLDWVVVGGESGPHARPMHPDWARSLRDQCVDAKVPFLFKQWGEHTAGELAEHPIHAGDGGAWRLDQRGKRWHDPMESSKPNNERAPIKFLKIGKKASGRLLDGQVWNEVPA